MSNIQLIGAVLALLTLVVFLGGFYWLLRR
jgi:hypothetical protein